MHQGLGQGFDSPRVVRVQPEWLSRAQSFARAVIRTTNYKDSHQSNPEKIARDHFISKIGEEAVREVFINLGYRVSEPDYTIYPSYQKSWQSDLRVNHTELAVKTQSVASAYRYSVSWLFQSGASRRDTLLSRPEAWVCFVSYEEQKQSCMVYPPHQIKELPFKEPRLEYLRGSKKAVYLQDLPRVNPVKV